MTDLTEVQKAVQRCEQILDQVEKRAADIESLFDKIEQKIEMVEKKSATMSHAEGQEIKQELMKAAKKAAKKAARKSIAIAQARENMGMDQSE